MGNITTQTTQNPLDDVVTVDTLQAAHPDLFTKPQLSWLLKTRHKNGLEQLGAVTQNFPETVHQEIDFHRLVPEAEGGRLIEHSRLYAMHHH